MPFISVFRFGVDKSRRRRTTNFTLTVLNTGSSVEHGPSPSVHNSYRLVVLFDLGPLMFCWYSRDLLKECLQ